MPKLDWREHEVIECLGVLPEFEEFFTSHSFRGTLGQLQFLITIWQDESLVGISLFNESEEFPFFTLHFIVRDRIEFVDDRDFVSLRFHDSVVVTSRFWNENDEGHGDLFDKNIFPTNIGFELFTHPRFELNVF